MGGRRAPGPQGIGSGGVHGVDQGTLSRTRNSTPRVTNGNRHIRQNPSTSAASAEEIVPRQVVARIYFPTNGRSLDDDDRQALAQLVKAIGDSQAMLNQVAALLVLGRADHRGSRAYNLRLAARRAIAVRNHLRTRLPGCLIYARTIGELRAQQPWLMSWTVTDKEMAEDRRVDVIYARFQIHVGTDVDVVIPPLPKLIEELKKLVEGKQSQYPNRCRRILCYLEKLKEKPTAENDGYWSFGDWVAVDKVVHQGGRLRYGWQNTCAREFKARRKSARKFLQEKIATKTKPEDKLTQIMHLDRIIFDSWQKTADKIANLGSQKIWPYWMLVKDHLITQNQNPKTLYACLKPRSRSHWDWLPT